MFLNILVGNQTRLTCRKAIIYDCLNKLCSIVSQTEKLKKLILKF